MVAAAAALTATGAFISSCRNVVVGDSVAVASELCGLIEECYGSEAPSCAEVEAALRGADAQVVASYLNGFDADVCLGSCADARACLDAEPLCGSGECEGELDCCGWSRGEAACGGRLPEAAGKCCLPDGIACDKDDQCCDSPCRRAGDDKSGKRTCGGSECTPIDGGCSENAECCSEVCIDGTCHIRDCVPLFEPCKGTEDCCPAPPNAMAISQPIECRDGSCQPAPGGDCAPYGEVCTLDGAVTCCDGVFCVPAVTQDFGQCGVEPCRPDYFGCEAHEQCCSGYCDSSSGTCGGGLYCTVDGNPCTAPIECCSQVCVDFVCGPSVGCADPGCHDICTEGPPMIPGTCPNVANSWCIDQVVSIDSFCSCQGWDSICVSEVYTFCQIDCGLPI